jgi:hypothetical protein
LIWKLEERDLQKGLDIDGKITDTQTLDKEEEECGLPSSSSGHGPVAGSCESSGSIKCWEFCMSSHSWTQLLGVS